MFKVRSYGLHHRTAKNSNRKKCGKDTQGSPRGPRSSFNVAQQLGAHTDEHPTPTSMQFPEAKAALDKEWTNLQKLTAWDESNVTSKAEVIRIARFRTQDSSFCHINGLVSSQELRFGENVPKKYEGRVVLTDDVVKDDSANNVALTEQGASASHKTAARVLDVVSRLPSCSGQARDSVRPHT